MIAHSNCSAVDKTPHFSTNVVIALPDVCTAKCYKCIIASSVIQLGGLLETCRAQCGASLSSHVVTIDACTWHKLRKETLCVMRQSFTLVIHSRKL